MKYMKYKGSYRILEILGNNIVKLVISDKRTRIVHNDMLKICQTRLIADSRVSMILYYHPKDAIFITSFAELSHIPRTTKPLLRWKDSHED